MESTLDAALYICLQDNTAASRTMRAIPGGPFPPPRVTYCPRNLFFKHVYSL
jgi:hypothetical protein